MTFENFFFPQKLTSTTQPENSGNGQCFPVIPLDTALQKKIPLLPRLGRLSRFNHQAEVTSEQSWRRKRSQRADVPAYPKGTLFLFVLEETTS